MDCTPSTIVLPQTAYLRLPARPNLLEHSQEAILKEAILQLTSLLYRFEDWEDDLSQQIFKWGAKTIALTSIETIEDEPAFLKMVERRIAKLCQKILVNPLSFNESQPILKEPCLIRGWVWEKAMFSDYLTLSTQNPFDQSDRQPLTEAKTPHAFAWEMLNWAKQLSSNTCEPERREEPLSSNGQLQVKRTANIAFNRLKHALYLKAASTAVLKRQNRQLQKEIKGSTLLVQALREEMQKAIAAEAKIAQQNAQERQEELEGRIAALEARSQGQVDQLQLEIDGSFMQLSAEIERRKAVESRVVLQERRIEQLREAFALKVRQVEELRRQVKKCKKRFIFF